MPAHNGTILKIRDKLLIRRKRRRRKGKEGKEGKKEKGRKKGKEEKERKKRKKGKKEIKKEMNKIKRNIMVMSRFFFTTRERKW